MRPTCEPLHPQADIFRGRLSYLAAPMWLTAASPGLTS